MAVEIQGGTEADRIAIAALHEADMEASRRQDFAALRALMSEDPVILAPGSQPLRGRAQVDASFARRGGASRSGEVLSYAIEWEEVRVLGDFAFEWGRITGAMRPAGTQAPPERLAYNVLRILTREPEGWKVHRTIWNDAPPD